MPFTPSHAAAALPLLRTRLMPAALVIGSTSPDFAFYTRLPVAPSLTHSARGVVTVDLLAGAVLLLTWLLLLRQPVHAAMPLAVRRRWDLPALRKPSVARGCSAVAALVVGASTHVLWDELTHSGGWGPRHVSWLRAEQGPLPGYSWAQNASGVVGALCLLGWTWLWLRRQEPRAEVDLGGGWSWAWAGTALVGAAAGLVAALPSLEAAPADLRSASFDGATTGGAWAACGAVLLAVLWHVRARRRGP